MKNSIDSTSRLSKSVVNVATGTILQFLTVILNFVVRIVFVRVIGYSYLGISSLFANILTILSVADLGFGTSISISLYSALKKSDKEHIAGIISYYKKIYLIIGAVIFGIGCVICPFINHLVNTETPIKFLEIFFFIYLVNLISTYFIAYRHAIIKADQKNGILNNINSVVLLVKSVIELLVLVTVPRVLNVQVAYTVYLVVMLLSTYAIEIWSSKKAKQMYPYAFEKKDILPQEKKEIKENVRSLLFYKVCKAVNKAVDGILISILVSTTILGKYSNYTLIIGTLMGFGCILSRNLIASLGNYILTESKEKQVRIFYLINFIHILIAAFFVVNYVGILQPFFVVAFGTDSILPIATLILTAVHLAFDVNYQVNELFRETTKMFRRIPYISLINLCLNIALSVVLGIFFGLEGIIAGTIISYFLTSFWFETYALFKFHFQASPKKVWLQLLFAVVSIVAFSLGAYFITTYVRIGDDFLQLIFSIMVSLVLSCLCLLSFAWFKEFKEIFEMAKGIVKSVYAKFTSLVYKAKTQLVILLASFIIFASLIIVRDLFAVEINKYILVGICFLSALLLSKEHLFGYLFFIIPFHSGIPSNIIYPLLLIVLVIKNGNIFIQNWRKLINYFLIPVLIGAYELLISHIYGSMTSLQDVLAIVAVLSVISMFVYDWKNVSFKPLYYFIIGTAVVCSIMFIHWIAISKYMADNTPIKTMTFIRILKGVRFGDVNDLITWTELWCQINYPHKTAMYLTDNPNYLGILVLSALMCSVYLFVKHKNLKSRIAFTLAGLLFVAIGAYTGSKSFFICFAIFMVLFILMMYGESQIKLWVTILILGVTGIATLLVCLFVPYVNENIIKRMMDDSGRFTLFKEYFAFIFSNPKYVIFGVGASRLPYVSGVTEPPHNALAQLIGGYGLLGFSIILFALVLTLWKGRPKFNIFNDKILVSMTPMVVFIVFSMTSQILLPVNTLVYGMPTLYLFIRRCNEIEKERQEIQ